MGYGQCVYRRSSGIYVIRLCVPPLLQARLGKREIHISTGLYVRALAIAAATTAIGHWRRFFAELTRLDLIKVVAGTPLLVGDGLIGLTDAADALGMQPAVLANELANVGARFHSYASGWAVRAVPDLRVVDREDYEYLWRSIEAHGEHRSATGIVALIGSQEVAQLLAQRGTAPVWRIQHDLPEETGGTFVEPGTVSLGAADLLVRKVDVESLRLRLARDATEEQIEAARTQRRLLSAAPPTSVIAGGPAPLPSRPVRRHETMRVSALIEAFIRAKTTIEVGKLRASWKPSETDRNRQKLRCFHEFMGDLTMAELELMPEAEEIIEEYLRRLVTMPTGPELSKARKALSGGTAPQLAEWAKSNGAARMSAQTAQDYLSKLSECFRWGLQKTYLSVNPAQGFSGDGRNREQRPDEARDTFNDGELKKIFSAEWFVTGKPRITVSGRATHHYRPFYYWLPLLALHLGGRANEIGQLYLDDFGTTEAGTHFITFQIDRPDKRDLDPGDTVIGPSEDKSLKTVNAKRTIPLHDELIRLGLLDYVNALRAAGHDRLFPELRFDKDKGYGLGARSWFNERYLGDQLKIKRDGKKTLHSLRHNFSHALTVAAADARVHNQLMGHLRGDRLAVTRYSKDGGADQVKPQIDRLTFVLPPVKPFDIQCGLDAVKRATAIKAANRRRKLAVVVDPVDAAIM